MLTPASRAASTFCRSGSVQYSSCPTDRNALWLASGAEPRLTSISVVYETSTPLRSRKRNVGYSLLNRKSRPPCHALVANGRL